MKLVTLSSTETEYVALCEAATEIVFLRRLLVSMGFPQTSPTITFEDNQSCIAMAHGAGDHQRTKHISPKYHYTREQINAGEMVVKHLKTTEMVADILTKGLGTSQFRYLRDILIICCPTHTSNLDFILSEHVLPNTRAT
jgi:hypothetical protein